MFNFLSAVTAEQWGYAFVVLFIYGIFISIYLRTIWGRRATIGGLLFFPFMTLVGNVGMCLYAFTLIDSLKFVEGVSQNTFFHYAMLSMDLLIFIIGAAYGVFRRRKLASCDITAWSVAARRCTLLPSPVIGTTLLVNAIGEIIAHIYSFFGYYWQPCNGIMWVLHIIGIGARCGLGILAGDCVWYVRELLAPQKKD